MTVTSPWMGLYDTAVPTICHSEIFWDIQRRRTFEDRKPEMGRICLWMFWNILVYLIWRRRARVEKWQSRRLFPISCCQPGRLAADCSQVSGFFLSHKLHPENWYKKYIYKQSVCHDIRIHDTGGSHKVVCQFDQPRYYVILVQSYPSITCIIGLTSDQLVKCPISVVLFGKHHA